MSSTTVLLSLSLLSTLAFANPLPSRILRRDPPAPSAYPLADACEHEWQYLNFDVDDTTDAANLATLHDILCSGEMRALTSYGSISAQDNLAPYARYFPASDDEDDYQGNVQGVLDLITGTSSSDGAIGSIVGSFVVDNLDFASSIDDEADCSDDGTLAYTLTDPLDSREKIHFCPTSYTRPNAASIDCSTLDPYPSTKLDTFSRIALHEMTHYSTVGPATQLAQQIQDVANADGEPAYDPERTHGLLDADQDDNPAVCEINADSYAWMSVDAWVSRKCAADASGNDWAAYFTQDPPDYEPVDDDE